MGLHRKVHLINRIMMITIMNWIDCVDLLVTPFQNYFGDTIWGLDSRSSKRAAIKHDHAEGRGFKSHRWRIFSWKKIPTSQGIVYCALRYRHVILDNWQRKLSDVRETITLGRYVTHKQALQNAKELQRESNDKNNFSRLFFIGDKCFIFQAW